MGMATSLASEIHEIAARIRTLAASGGTIGNDDLSAIIAAVESLRSLTLGGVGDDDDTVMEEATPHRSG